MAKLIFSSQVITDGALYTEIYLLDSCMQNSHSYGQTACYSSITMAP